MRSHTVKFDVFWEIGSPGQNLQSDVGVPNAQSVPTRGRNDEHVAIGLKLGGLGVVGPIHVEEMQVLPLAQAEGQPLNDGPVEDHGQEIERAHAVHGLHDNGQAGAPRALDIGNEGCEGPQGVGADGDGDGGEEDTHCLREKDYLLTYLTAVDNID